ncbi:S8 family serine peptidase [Rhodoplanes sp. TEM]|uniref:S8 family serine peptidase n=1 Tax=Rhodoplanes tepidamans TaxID=200616 RepID=A0ABT5JE93_RHOTP|nr:MULTISPECIES: S8 family serine peptidase [Rhodoplanes]MDC7787937.1 S8 family serine peptidase [Rhodoplanes tepidamans]MDC7986911.1 S8 family serine peptidase [Rhodoplanes sp. TEM]MDQ0358366.1 hypothetical protein [Rhodoplanes tepidamans]
MRIPVLAILPSQEPLIESATAAAVRRAPQIGLESTTVPPGLTLDPAFPAVPVGKGLTAGATLEALAPTQSQNFAVRGFIEAEDPREIPTESDGRPLFADPVIAPFLTCGGTPPVGTAADVATRLNVPTLAARGLDGDGVAVAIMDTGINLAHLQRKLGAFPRLDVGNSWTPAGATAGPGKHPVDHGTMCAYDALIAAPKATLLDYPILATTAPGGSVTGSTLSVALQAFAQLIAFWAVAFAPGGALRYKALVVNNSWGIFHPSWDFPPGHPGRYIDNPNHPFSLIVGVLARAGADILFAAGNCGGECADGRCQARTTETIMGANASPDVLTLAGCDVTDTRVGYSSQGPSIAGMFQQKPDITAYTHFLGSEAFGQGSPDSGTSAACPVAAGCVAALRTRLSPQAMPPRNLFAQLTTTARQVQGGPGWNRNYGHGIIDPDAAGQSAGV